MKKQLFLFSILLLTGAAGLPAADVMRLSFPPAAGAANSSSAQLVSVDNLVFPAGICGTGADPLGQVDEVIEKMHAVLARKGLGIGNMLQHTIFLKDGALSPMAVLQRFHATATKLAPSLKTTPGVGTIIRVPELPEKQAVIMLDLVAGVPVENNPEPDGYTRLRFTFGPQEIAETIADGKILFTAGTEGLDFQHGTLGKTIDEQIVTVVNKLDAAVKKAGFSLSQMIQHNLYVTKGIDPMQVIRKFHEEIRKHDPDAPKFPGAGSLMVVDGMAAPGFLLEMDAVFTKKEPAAVKRIPFTEVPMDVVKTAGIDGLVFVTAMPGAVLRQGMALPPDINQQIEQAVKNISQALKESGLTLASMVKHRLIMKKGAADPARVRAKFHETVARLTPGIKVNLSAETFLIVEALESPAGLFEASVIAARQ